MTDNILGELRRSAAVLSFGPGSIVDFRSDGAPVSVVISGLEWWDKGFPPKGLANIQKLSEPRLERKLRVAGFRLPPVCEETGPGGEGEDQRALPAARFPDWLQCPSCDLIRPSRSWSNEPGRVSKYCSACTSKAPGQRKIYVIPVRFITACTHGHLDDFPWHWWANHKSDCTNKKDLYLKSEGPGLAGMILSCPTCGRSRSMDGVFHRSALEHLSCGGRRPWLGEDASETCTAVVPARVLQRGATNLYFPVLESALSIPPWSDHIQDAMGQWWGQYLNVDKEQRLMWLQLNRTNMEDILEDLRLSPEELHEELERRERILDDVSNEDLRIEEYRRLGAAFPSEKQRDFDIRIEATLPRLQRYVDRLVRVVRLREVKAQVGFSRINPPVSITDPAIARISLQSMRWYPAVEVRGEGLFFTLNSDELKSWASSPAVRERVDQIRSSYLSDWVGRGLEGTAPVNVDASFLLVHTLAHVLILELSLECGYSTASIRERIYAGSHDEDMCGVLIYTAAPDSDGTLGGLQRLAQSRRFEQILVSGISRVAWCSNDPLCSEGVIARDGSYSLAGCHSCVLVPETSCEYMNQFLDRALLVGTPDKPDIGFFSGLIKEG